MLTLPYSMQSFSHLRKKKCLYVDKTKYAYDLIIQEQNFFLSRPRRFGKSVFISTLKEILLGKKNLFHNLQYFISHLAPCDYPLRLQAGDRLFGRHALAV